MYLNEGLLIGKNDKKEVYLLPKMANRHGLITGASGTGKTITSKVMAESLSDLGVPVFMADVKGDLAGTAVKGDFNENIQKRVEKLKLKDFDVKEFPVRFWDIYTKSGHPIRFKVSSVGPNILSIMLGLSEAQEGVLNIVFKVAEDESLDLDDLTDLKKALNYVGQNRNKYTTSYGNVTTQSIGVILRSLSVLENQGLDNFFGEPELDIQDFISVNNEGKGIINILDAVELYKNPDLYSAVMLCLLTKLYDHMPEVGDLDKPRIVFFFDEAYFLFREMPSYRLKQVEKIVRLIRSKGIGLYFISHYTTDIPANVLDQLGNRVQHNLRAYTPADQKIAKAAADSFRTNPSFKTYETILELGTGEAIVSFQNEKGEPEVCERVYILPPQSQIGVIDDMTRNRIINNSPLVGKYDEKTNDESASEKIDKLNEEETAKKAEEQRIKDEEKAQKEAEKLAEKERKQKEKEARELERKKRNSIPRKVGRRVASRVEGRLITKALNAFERMLKK
jgi:DNA helicase HerA-like ATPase